jgi:hypothetical protein
MPTKKSEAVFDMQTSRRELLKKAAYTAPVILTLAAIPAFAAKGSGEKSHKGKGISKGVPVAQ